MSKYINVEHIPYEDGFDRVNGDHQFIDGIETMQEWIKSQNAIDIVRCKDCKFREGTPGQPNIMCGNMKDDDFCSYGEKREDH